MKAIIGNNELYDIENLVEKKSHLINKIIDIIDNINIDP